ncbi:MAG: alpha/beta hydrolase [Bacteroidota bacterium]
MIKKAGIGLVGLLVLVFLSFVVGPKPTFEPINNTPSQTVYDIAKLDQLIADREAKVEGIKSDNEARIVWADSTKQRTPYSIVYLHGFSASQGEGFPIHLNLADSLDMNLYLPRLPEHGIAGEEAMTSLTPKLLVDAAKDAIAIGRSIGEKVIVMSCSTGGTLSIFLSANDPSIAAQILLSPNIEIKNSSAKLVTGPWGKQLAYQVMGTTRSYPVENEDHGKYWSTAYSTNGVIALQALLDNTMKPEIFEAIKTPVYCGYYYKDEEEQDNVVSVEAMLEFREQLQIPADDIEYDAFPDAGNHVIGCSYRNPYWQRVESEIYDFIKTEFM